MFSNCVQIREDPDESDSNIEAIVILHSNTVNIQDQLIQRFNKIMKDPGS